MAIRKTETLAERYLLLDSLLFRLNTTPGKELAVYCIVRIIALYHSGILQDIKVSLNQLTINEKFFIPHLVHYLKSYIKG